MKKISYVFIMLCSDDNIDNGVYSDETLESWSPTFHHSEKQSIQTPWSTNGSGTIFTDANWADTMGYSFTPQRDGIITKLGGCFNGTKTVSLWNTGTGELLTTVDVTSANSWSFTEISPVAVHTGTTYTVAVYLNGSGGAVQLLETNNVLPYTYGDITIEASVITPGNARPDVSMADFMYGMVDVGFTAH